jgi:SAM-dependent methyltransferase
VIKVYTGSATWYDRFHANKDYAGEAQRVTSVIRAHHPGAQTLLDAACGTGRHLEHLRGEFACAGFDLDPGLLAMARDRLPGLELAQADLTEFELHRRFDAVICLFSSIGYVQTLARLEAAVRSLARHLNPDGVLVIEPWILPEAWDEWVAQTNNLYVGQDGDRTLVRLRDTRRAGNMTELIMHYAVAENGEIATADERHQVRMFTVDEILGAMGRAGLSAHWDPAGIIGRGLAVGVGPGGPDGDMAAPGGGR